MAFFEELGNKVSQAGNRLAEAARNSSQTTQLENDIRAMQAEIDGCLHQMGAMLYYGKKNPDAPKPDFDPIIAHIDHLTQNLDWAIRENDRLHGVVRCPQCRTAVAIGTPFCPNCGSALPVPPPPPGFQGGPQPMQGAPGPMPQGGPQPMQGAPGPMPQGGPQPMQGAPGPMPQGGPQEPTTPNNENP